MASQQNVELEAAKFLHKLIQDSTDEPAKLATKLYVILQHMKSSGKEHSMPYQVISRAMETVINQHGLDIEALKSSRLPSSGGTHVGDSSAARLAGSSSAAGVAKDTQAGLAENEMAKIDAFASSRPPVGPSSAGHDIYQGSVSHKSGGKSFDHESPSSLDTRSANSQSQERRDSANWEKQVNQKDSKKSNAKRKRTDPSPAMEPHVDNPNHPDTRNSVVNPRKGKLMNKVESPGSFSVKSGAAAKIHGGMPSSYPVVEPGFSSSMQFSGSSYDNHALVAKMHKERNMEAFSAMNSSLLEASSGKNAVDAEQWKHGLMRSAVIGAPEKTIEAQMLSGNHGEEESKTLSIGKVLDHEGGTSIHQEMQIKWLRAGGQTWLQK